VFTTPPVRRKIQEKRMRKMEAALRELAPPRLEGPEDAEVTLIGWGSTTGVIREAVALLAEEGVRANHLQIKYLHPFHSKEVSEILSGSKRTICVECNYTAQFARHLRAETGFSVNDLILKYDGEPFEPHHIVEQVQSILAGAQRSLDVTMDEAREIAYHYTRVHLSDKLRPAKFKQEDGDNERLWVVEMVGRQSGETEGELRVGAETGSIYSWERTKVMSAGASSD
ncbi:MAG: transketolase C-terminal domain-containing protein, partial [Blastocatellia bacterium]